MIPWSLHFFVLVQRVQVMLLSNHKIELTTICGQQLDKAMTDLLTADHDIAVVFVRDQVLAWKRHGTELCTTCIVTVLTDIFSGNNNCNWFLLLTWNCVINQTNHRSILNGNDPPPRIKTATTTYVQVWHAIISTHISRVDKQFGVGQTAKNFQLSVTETIRTDKSKVNF